MSTTQGTNEKVGTVNDILVDEQGQFRYLVLDLGGWIFGKKVLLPIGRSQIDQQAGRVHAVGLTKAQAGALPEFNDRAMPDSDHEEQVRGVFRPPAAGAAMTGTSQLSQARRLTTAITTPTSKIRLCTI